ncbi:MAG: nitrous oxide-stimulated promoter family protein [Eggerthellaceae bacterium]|nr:nitrous oxide-stimulated promoter family protein [Eggerthellaceae bacterium]
MGKTTEQRDRATLEAMGRIFCSSKHKEAEKDEAGLCTQCRSTIEATLERTAICPYGHAGNCQDCDIHCQRGEARERIREIMRYAAPRMTILHPLMTAEYLRKKVKGKRSETRFDAV